MVLDTWATSSLTPQIAAELPQAKGKVKIPFSLINQSVLTFFKSFLNTVFAVICMAVLVLLLNFIIGETLIPEFKIVILIFSGIIIYILFTIMINKKTLNDMKSIFNNYILHSKLSSID